MKSLYQKEQVKAPEGFTNPTSSFKKHVVLAFAGLGAFVTIYLGLLILFGYQSFTLLETVFSGNSSNGFWQFILGAGLAFLSIFMFKSLFIFSKNADYDGKEVTQNDYPLLLDFLYQLADEIGAPRPHKVYLSSRVNASVFYDLSILNLLYPTKKNLEIGLGLVNVLNLGEFKAVLAHEFGHFAQKSMLLGRYVYTAQQIAARVVNQRDALDSFLAGLSSIDLRIAWIGWILSILVWAIRSLIETLFSVVAIAERALSREMEFQADTVAVSVTGSDALIHALHKLKAADQGYQSTIEHINRELQDKKAVFDMFSLQSNYIEKMQWILDDPLYGKSPELVDEGGKNRIFKSGIVNPPEMWATHPSDNDREDNAKRNYLFANIDNTPVWDLFENTDELRTNITSEFIATAKVETELLTNEESIERFNNEDFNWKFLDPKYNGVYINRFPFINVKTVDEIYDYKIENENKKDVIRNLYTKDFGDKVKQLKELELEVQMLEAVKHEVVTAEKRKIMHRGEEIKRKDLAGIMKSVKREIYTLRKEIIEHDKTCRKISYEIAEKENPNYSKYLVSVSRLNHYAEHTITNLEDVYRKYNNVLAVVLADGRISDSEMPRLISATNQLYAVLKYIFEDSQVIELNETMIKKIGNKKYSELFEEFTLWYASEENLSDWVNTVGYWINMALEGLYKLRNASLEHLLDCEDTINNSYVKDEKAYLFIDTIINVGSYTTLIPGDERKLQYKLDFWDRFHASDGMLPTLAKFAVSALLIVAALTFGKLAEDNSYIHAYNGLNASVKVAFNDEEYILIPHSKEVIEYSSVKNKKIITTNSEGEIIEEFIPQLERRSGQYIYNIANSSLLIEHSIPYGNATPLPDFYYGTPRWMEAKTDYIIEQTPENISLSSNQYGDTRSLINAYSNVNPGQLINAMGKDADPNSMILSHAKWDNADSPHILQWFYYASNIDSTLNFAKNRLTKNTREISTYRIFMDKSDSTKNIACNQLDNEFKDTFTKAELYYLKTRCIEDRKEKNIAFIKGHENWPENPWLGMAASYCYAAKHEWVKAFNALGTAASNNESILYTNGDDLERMKRMAAMSDKTANKFDILLNKNERVLFYKDLENETISQTGAPWNQAVNLISQGKFMPAMKIANENQDIMKLINLMIASSDKSLTDISDNIDLADYKEIINENTVWMALGLAINNNQKYDKYLKNISEFLSYSSRYYKTEHTKKIIKALKAKNVIQAEKLMLSFEDFRVQSRHFLLGVIVLKEKAPKKWKLLADKLLFANEKPYISLDNS